MDQVVQVGRTYGLESKQKKTVMLRVRGSGDVHRPDGQPLSIVIDAVYLGGLISTSGNSAPELSRWLGEATSLFKSLCAVWKHANIPRARKVAIFDACVVSKLLYGLESLWLLKSDLQRLDAFQARCLRNISGIAPSYISRVRNADVLANLGASTLSGNLLRRQVCLYKKIPMQGPNSLARRVALEPRGEQPKDWHPVRRVGWPTQRWCKQVHELMISSV